MKNIINWTFGGFFRALGRILCFLVIGAIIALIALKSDFNLPSWLSIMRVNADSFDYTLGQYRLQYHMGNSNTWIGPYDFNTSTDTSSYDYIKAFAVRLGNSNKFVGMREYTVSIEVGFSPIGNAINNAYTAPTSFSCSGSTSLSSWSADSSKVDSCEFVGATRVGSTNHIKYIYKIKMKQDIVGIQININLYDNPPYGVNGFNVYKNTSITFGEDVSGAIDNQTIIIQNEINNLEDVINENNNNLINIINENNQTCEAIVVSLNTPRMVSGAFNSACRQVSSSTAKVSPYYRLSSTSTINGLRSGGYACFYDDTKTVIGSRVASSAASMTIPSNAKYVRFQVPGQTYEFFNVYTCQSNTDSTNSHIDDINDTLNDTDVDSDTNSLADFFNNFNTNLEGPISSIVLLPVDLLQTLIVDYNESATHPGLCATLKGQEFCIPSGDLIWKRSGCHDNSPFGCPDYVSFKQFFQLVAGGFIIYRLLKRIVKVIDKALDPTNSEVKVMEL